MKVIQTAIPDLLIRLRQEVARPPSGTPPHPLQGQGASYRLTTAWVWRLWAAVYGHPVGYRLFSWCATRFRRLTPRRQGGWTAHRTPLIPAAHSLHEQLQRRRPTAPAAPESHRP